MTKKELSRYYYLSKEIADIQLKIDEIRSTYIGASKLNGMPHSRTLNSPQETLMLLIEKYQQKLEYKKSEAIKEMLKIETYLLDIKDVDIRKIFNYRYVERKSWEQIAMLMHMSRATVFRKHQEQLKEDNGI